MMNHDKHITKLTVPNDISFLPVIHAYVTEVAKKAGFEKQSLSAIQLGVEEAVTNVIEHAFDPDQHETFDIICEPITLGLKIIIKEKGIPFDPSLLPRYDKERLETELSDKGLGLYLMQEFMDEVSFHNLGRDGKETHLVKYVSAKTVQEYFHSAELETIKREQEQKAGTPAAPSYVVRLMKSSEAVEVSKCAFMAYGYTYTNEDIYYPDRIRDLNSSGKVISLVAATDQDEIIGHAALVIDDYDTAIAEAAMGFVKPKYRGHGCLNSLLTTLPEEARRRNLTGLYGEATTVHPYSQKASQKMGLRDCALLLSKMPAAEYKDIQSDSSQRRSYIYCFRYLQPPGPTAVHVPPHHRDMVEKLYAAIGMHQQMDVPDAAGDSGSAEDGSIKVSTTSTMTAKIEIISCGKQVVAEVAKVLKRLCAERLETIYLYLNISDPHTAAMTAACEDLGFFFAGILPGSSGKDRLLLQYLNNQVLDYSSIQIASDVGKELLAYVRERDPYQKPG